MRAHNFKDLSGKKFGKWLVISYAYNSGTKKKQPFWYCTCDCGTNKIVGSNSLRNGSSSCGGCGTKGREKLNHNADIEQILIAKNVMARYKIEAKNRNYCFELSFEIFYKLIKDNCFYCEATPASFQHGKRNHKFFYNGIDRVDNSLGYMENNCVTCCKKCNSKKKATTKDMIYKAYHFLFKNNNEVS